MLRNRVLQNTASAGLTFRGLFGDCRSRPDHVSGMKASINLILRSLNRDAFQKLMPYFEATANICACPATELDGRSY